MIDKEEESIVEIGKFTKQLKEKTKQKIIKGASVLKIIEFIENEIYNANYTPAFPATISINDIAAHFTVYDKDFVLEVGDLVKVDFGACNKEGFMTDNAFTIEIESSKYEKLIEANKKGLQKAIETAQIGTQMFEIGDIVDNIAQDGGFNTIHNLMGHQISKFNLHTGMQVPNYNNFDKTRIVENITLAIEPFFTTGAPKVKSTGRSNILHLVSKDKGVRDSIAKNILKVIEEKYLHLPFSKRWLLKDFSKQQVNYGVQILKKFGILHEYDTLSTVDGHYVSQFEDMITFIDDKKIVVTQQK